MTENTTYNGWTSYSTWKLNLEMCDDIIESLRDDTPRYRDPFNDLLSLMDYLRDTCEEYVRGEDYDEKNLATQYAMDFLGTVNWYEIAKSHADDNPWLFASDEDDDEADDDDN